MSSCRRSIRQTGALVLDRNGVLLRPFAVADGRWRLPVALAEVDPLFVDTLIAYEDRRFRRHRGVDFRAWRVPVGSSSAIAARSPARRHSPCRSRGCLAGARPEAPAASFRRC